MPTNDLDYAGAGHPSSPSDDDSSDTIEMTNLEEDVVATPNPHRQGYHAPFLQDEQGSDGNESDDEDADGEDDGERALLGSSRRTRSRERSPGPKLGVWPHMKSIVIEVRKLNISLLAGSFVSLVVWRYACTIFQTLRHVATGRKCLVWLDL